MHINLDLSQTATVTIKQESNLSFLCLQSKVSFLNTFKMWLIKYNKNYISYGSLDSAIPYYIEI